MLACVQLCLVMIRWDSCLCSRLKEDGRTFSNSFQKPMFPEICVDMHSGLCILDYTF